MKKNVNLFRPILYIVTGCCVAMTLASLFFSLPLFYICLGVTLVCTGLILWQLYVIRRYINTFLIEMGRALTTVQQDALLAFPIPVFVCNGEGEILWCNRLAQNHVLEDENVYAKSIQSVAPGLDVTRKCPEKGHEVVYKGRSYVAYNVRAVSRDSELYMVYFFENTELRRYADEYFETRPSVMILLVDNYEELSQNLKDNERTRVMGQIEYVVSKFLTESGALMLRTERDRFLAVIEERNLQGIISARFALLEQVR